MTSDTNSSGGGASAFTVLALVVGALGAVGTVAITALSMGLGGPLLALLSLPVGRFFSRTRVGTRDDEKPDYARVARLELVRRVWGLRLRAFAIGKTGIYTAVGSVAFALTPWQLLLGSTAGSVVHYVVLALGLVGGFAVIGAAFAVGQRFRRVTLVRLTERAQYADKLRYISGLTETAWATASWNIDRVTSSIVITSPPEAVAAAQRSLDRVQQVLPGWTVDRERSGQTAVLREETPNETRRRKIAVSSDGLVLDVSHRGDGYWNLELAAGISPTRAETVEAWLQTAANGLSLVSWEPLYARALAGHMTAEDRALRGRIASLLGLHPHEVSIMVTSDAEGVAQIIIKAPAGRAVDGESRLTQMRRVMLQAVPGAHADWAVAVDSVTDVTRMERRTRRALPTRVALEQILPATLTPTDWANIPAGLDAFGRPAGQLLTSAPMSMVVGPTGSGKTIMLLADAVGRLTRGHDLLIIDPSKAGVDFASLEPYALGFARTYEQSVAALKCIYAEGQRRKAIILQEGAVKWSALSQEVRDAQHIRPVTVLIDEVSSMLIQVQVPKGLAKDDPDFIEAQGLANQKALLSMYLGKVARELRFAGVFLLIAMQRPDANIIGGEVRANFSHRVQLVPPRKPVGRTELEMLFPAPIVGAVWDAVDRFDDGNHGLAVMAGDEGDVTPVRIGYADMNQLPALLSARGVRPIDPDRRINLASAPRPEPASAPAAESTFGDLFA